jgi:hypothetical protein
MFEIAFFLGSLCVRLTLLLVSGSGFAFQLSFRLLLFPHHFSLDGNFILWAGQDLFSSISKLQSGQCLACILTGACDGR